jgi:hypothetical protein
VSELAVAAGDAPIVTFNRRDFRGGEFRFPSIVAQTPATWLNSQVLNSFPSGVPGPEARSGRRGSLGHRPNEGVG